MARISVSYLRAALAPLLVLFLLSVGLAGCGEPDECAGVSCDFGVCQAGVCDNPNSCETDDQCLPGYACGAGGACEAAMPCRSNGECATGRCSGGQCVNPPTCESNEECLDRTYCADDGTCQPDPCNDVECDSGQCQRGTTQCVSADSCTVETEAQDCLDGDICFEGSCVDEAGFCEALTCERGVCDFGSRSCVNADTCAEDSECLDGLVCNDAGECTEDLCEQNEVTCDDGGVCIPSIGECENADPCASNDECLAGHWCVEGTCRLQENACGDAACPGGQVCEHDEETLTASCEESGNCQNALGCQDGRQCAGGLCLEPMPCEDDYLEPNDSQEEATDFFSYQNALAVEASVCSEDADYFAVDTREIANAPLRGTLVVTAAYAPRDVGLGEVEVEVTGPLGNTSTATSGSMGRDGMAQVRMTVNAAGHGVYTVRVAAADEMNSAGVSYVLSADLLNADYTEVADEAVELEAGNPISATTVDATSYEMGSTCTTPHNPAQENIYWFELDEPTEVSLSATPTSRNPNMDVSLSVRTDLERLSSEVACANTSDQGGEVLDTLLAPGRYYVMVEAGSGSNGAYILSMSEEARSCAPAQNSCLDPDTAEQCVNGARTTEVSCQLGCDYRTGACMAAQGDTCELAAEVNSSDFVDTIVWNNYTNRLEMPNGSCVPSTGSGTQTGGREAVYEVALEPGFALFAELSLPSGEHGSLYVLEGCYKEESACVAGANDGSAQTEQLKYVNESNRPTVVYLVADSAGNGQSSAELSVQVGDVICEPGAEMCGAGGDVVECNAMGTAWQVITDCQGFGCTNGQCNPECTPGEVLGCSATATGRLEYCADNETIAEFSCPSGVCSNGSCDSPEGDVCLDAIPAVDGTNLSGDFSELNSDYSSGSCPAQRGPDQVFKVELEAYETVTATLSGSVDTSLYVVDDCMSSDFTCLEGVNDNWAGPETLSYSAGSSPETVYIIGGPYYASDTSGTYTIDFTID